MSTPTEEHLCWFVAVGKQKTGPFSLGELREQVRRGQLKPNDMLLQHGGVRWFPASETPGLFDPEPSTTPPSDFPVRPSEFPAIPGYEIVEKLGQGGMGVVYRAKQTRLNRTVALKMIRSGSEATADEKARFLIEAEAGARLQHPNIVQIHEIGEQDGCPYFCLEFVEGGSLERRLAGEPQPPSAAALLVETLARAVDHAHQLGIVHRDIKPANILLQEGLNHRDTETQRRQEEKREENDSKGNSPSPLLCASVPLWFNSIPKIADFGLAKRLEAPDRLTHTGAVVGTPSYMAPEQAQGQTDKIGPLVDVYALGAVLYKMLTGRPPFRGASTAETLMLVISTEPVAPHQLRPGVPRDLETICLKCLRKEPEKRYASANELANDLKNFLDGKPVKARPLGRIARADRWCRRNPRLAVVSFLLVAALVFGVSGIAWKWREAVVIAEEERIQRERADENAENAENREFLNARYVYTFRMAEVANAWDNGDEEETQRHLEAFLPRPGQKYDLRGFEWYRYWKMTRGSRLTLSGHAGTIGALAFSHDSRLLASGGHDTQVYLWDVQTGARRASVDMPQAIQSLAFAPGDRTLFIGNGVNFVHTYDVQKKALTPEAFPAVRHPDVVVSPDGRFVFLRDGAILVRALPQGNKAATIPVVVDCLAVLPDSRTLVCGVRGALEVHGVEGDWVAAPVRRLHHVEAHAGKVNHLALDRAGKVLVTAGADGVKTWDMEKGKPPTLRVSSASAKLPTVTALALAADGKRLFLAGADRMIRAFDPRTLAPLGQFNRHSKTITQFAVSPDGKHLASGGAEGAVKVWSIAEMRQTASWFSRENAGSRVLAVAFSADDRMVATGGADGVVRVHDINSRRERFAFRDHGAEIQGVAFLPGKQGLLSIDRDGVVCRHDLQKGVLLHCRRLDGDVTSFAASADDAVVACGSSDGVVRLLSPSSEILRTTRAHGTRVLALAFSPDGRALLSGGQDGSVSLTDVPAGSSRPCATQLVYPIHSVVFSHDGSELLACNSQGVEAVWNRDREPVRQPVNHSQSSVLVRHPRRKSLLRLQGSGDASRLVQSDDFIHHFWVSESVPGVLACSRSGNLAAVTDAVGVVALLKIQEGDWERLFRLTGHAHGVHALAWSADGKRLARGDGARVRLLGETGLLESAVLSGHDDLVVGVAFSPDGCTLATASLDGTVGLWESDSGRRLARLAGAVLPVRAVAFSPDGRTLAAGGGRTNQQGEVLFWDVASGRRLGALPFQRWAVRGLAFTANDRLITVSGDGYNIPGALKVWEVASGKELFHMVPHPGPINHLALSADGTQLATAGKHDSAIRLWEVQRDALLPRHTLRPMPMSPLVGRLDASWFGDGGVKSPGTIGLAFSPDGRTLASANRDRDVFLWQPELGRLLGRAFLPVHVSALAFHPDNQILAAGEFGGRLRLVNAPREVHPDRGASQSDSDKDLRDEIDQFQVKAKKALADFLGREGDRAGEQETLTQMENVLERLLVRAPGSRTLQEQQVALQIRLARRTPLDPLAREGYFLRAAKTAADLLAAEPTLPCYLTVRGYPLWRRGATRFQAGRLDEALGPLEEAAAVYQQLAAQVPNHFNVLYNLAELHLDLGKVYRARKQTSRALGSFRAAVLWFETCGLRTGWFRQPVRGRLIEALEGYCRCARELPPASRASATELAAHRLRVHEMAEQVVLHEPDNIANRQWAVRVCRGQWDEQRIGFVAGKFVYSDEADDRFRQGAAHYKALLRLQPDEKKHDDGLVSWLSTWAKMLKAGRRFTQMEKVCIRLLEETRRIRDKEPTNLTNQFNCLLAVHPLLEALLPQKRFADGCRWIRTTAREVEGVRSLDKDSTLRLRRACGWILNTLPELEAIQGNYEEVETAVEERLRWPIDRAENWLDLAESLARCSAMVRQDARRPLPMREKIANRLAGRVVEFLRKAVELNPPLRLELAARAAFAGLRDRADFKELVGK